jgi:hypothetical protein
MGDEREKINHQNDEPEVEAHKDLKATDEGGSDDEGPDVEAHKVLKKTEK